MREDREEERVERFGEGVEEGAAVFFGLADVDLGVDRPGEDQSG